MVARTRVRVCVDCPPGSKRKAPKPGPRCVTHDREVKKARSRAAHARYVEETYGITGEEYWALHEAQGGKCYICRRATGARKRLAVDHDHSHCPGPKGCRECCRGLLCRSCNRDVLGHLRDDVAALERAIDYLSNPPAKRVLSFAR